MPNTRLNAVLALSNIFTQGARPKEALDPFFSSLEKRDRAFLMEMTYGVLRYRDTLDWILKDFLKNPAKLGDFTLNNIRLALYQIFFMRVPDWATVNEAVELEKISSSDIAPGKPSLVNAVLRNVLRRKQEIALPVAINDPVQNIAVNTSHPLWMVKRWATRFGIDEAAALAEANNKVPRLTIRVNTLKTSRGDLLRTLADNGVSAALTTFSPDGIILSNVGAVDELSFAGGLFSVQNEASQLVTYLLDPRPGERVLDACAAPGGKTTHIAQLMNDTGEIIAVEEVPERAGKLQDSIRSLGLNSVKTVTADFQNMKGHGSFDRVLLDAPCSAIGVIRRNPDIKYRRKARDLQDYSLKQTAMLVSASRFVKEGGILTYAVCSTEPEEGEQVANKFLKTADEFRIIDTCVMCLKDLVTDGFFRTFPHKHTMDGFFGVSMCRKK